MQIARANPRPKFAKEKEKHLPHEAWHVVQQMQGRVKHSMQMKGDININDDVGLEKEADAMGKNAMQNAAKPASTQKNRSHTGEQMVQRKVKYSGGEDSVYLDTIIKKWSQRMDLYQMADEDPNINIEIELDESKKGEEDLNVIGLTRGAIHVENGKKAFYYLDNSIKNPEKALSEAIKNGDHLKTSGLQIKVKVNANPLFDILKEGKKVGRDNVPISMEHKMVVFTHEWELHVAPMLELYKWIRVQQEIIEKQGKPNDALTKEQLQPLLNLLQGGEAAEHLDDTNLAYFFAALHRAKAKIGDPQAVERVWTAELMEMTNLKVSKEKKNNLLEAVGIKQKMVDIEQETVGIKGLDPQKLNVVGEDHGESGQRRDQEKDLNEKFGILRDQYYLESEFTYTTDEGDLVKGDPDHKRDAFCAAMIADTMDYIADLILKFDREKENDISYTDGWIDEISKQFESVDECIAVLEESGAQEVEAKIISHFIKLTRKGKKKIDDLMKAILDPMGGINIDKAVSRLKGKKISELISESHNVIEIVVKKDMPSNYQGIMSNLKKNKVEDNKSIMSNTRSITMHEAAQNSTKKGVWKVGWVLAKEIEMHCEKNDIKRNYNLILREDYNRLF